MSKLFPLVYLHTYLPLHLVIPGFTHSPSFRLFEVGKPASAAVKEFAETAGTEAVDSIGNATSANDFFDSFAAPPVTQGAGASEAKLFVDGNHTRVSDTSTTAMLTTTTTIAAAAEKTAKATATTTIQQ